MEVSEAIRKKRAIRTFKDQAIPQDIAETILYAGRRAQSSKNSQPWHFIAVRDKNQLKSLSECGHYAGHLAGAAMGVAILTPDPAQRFSIMFDAGQAAAYMQLAAWDHGIGSCLATIYEPDAAREILGFPDDLHIRIAISFGYPMDAERIDQPPEKGGRRPFEEVVHWETW